MPSLAPYTRRMSEARRNLQAKSCRCYLVAENRVRQVLFTAILN